MELIDFGTRSCSLSDTKLLKTDPASIRFRTVLVPTQSYDRCSCSFFYLFHKTKHISAENWSEERDHTARGAIIYPWSSRTALLITLKRERGSYLPALFLKKLNSTCQSALVLMYIYRDILMLLWTSHLTNRSSWQVYSCCDNYWTAPPCGQHADC